MFATPHSNPTIARRASQLDVANLLLAYTNSLLFSALFSFDTVWVFLVKGVFNGLGILMVIGLLSLIAGHLTAYFKPADGGASHYTSLILLLLQAIFGAIVLVAVVA